MSTYFGPLALSPDGKTVLSFTVADGIKLDGATITLELTNGTTVSNITSGVTINIHERLITFVVQNPSGGSLGYATYRLRVTESGATTDFITHKGAVIWA